MASQLQIFTCAICVLGFLGLAASDDKEFPKFEDLVILSYTTEVQITDTVQQTTAYATEYYDTQTGGTGKLEIIVDGKILDTYYKNETYQVLEVEGNKCQVWGIDESPYTTSAAFYGWYNKDPLVVGPSAPLYYAKNRRNDIKFAGKEDVRNIPCDKFTLDIIDDRESVTLEYYFAPADWTTPYQLEGLRVPIRIRAVGNSSKETESANVTVPIDVITDFAYFKPYLDYDLDLEPPVGIGCYLRTASDRFPTIPEVFQYSAEVIDLLYEAENTDVDVRLERVWYDSINKIGRFDTFKRTTSLSSFQDFNTGVMFQFTKERKCSALPLKNGFFEIYDVDMVGRMKTGSEVLKLGGDFYKMGQRNIRGIICETYESVQKEVDFKDKKFDRLVTTAYFSENFLKVGVDGEDETGIPAVIVLTGWDESNKMVLKLQYNIFSFKDVIWPPMTSDFGIDMCYTRSESKTYFVLVIEATANDAAKMEAQDNFVSAELRGLIAKYAVIPEWRLPFLKVDYKATGVYAMGMMIERPPALLQFTEFDNGDETTYKNDIAILPSAYTLEECAAACIDYSKDPCKGFYFCNGDCFAKMTDPTESHDSEDEKITLENCSEFIRVERESTNVGNTPLTTALEKLEKAIMNQSLEVFFEIPNGDEVIKVTDIVIGEGPYTGGGGQEKPYKISVQYRKLDSSLESNTVARGAEMLNDCYRNCKAAGSECSAFSFCGRSKSQNKECILSYDMVVSGKTDKDNDDFVPAMDCDIYSLKYLEYFTKYPEHASFVTGYKINTNVDTVEECAKQCRLEENDKCRGFEYCQNKKECSLHSKHILDLGPGEKGKAGKGSSCIHYSARFIADYLNMGNVYLEDNSNVRYEISLEECAQVCSKELGESCRSFNFCPSKGGSCGFSKKVLTDNNVKTSIKEDCKHFEKRNGVDDWNNSKAKELSKSGWTTKGFTGLVIGMLAFGLIIGALGFVGYSYVRSRQQGEGLTVRFMKQEM